MELTKKTLNSGGKAIDGFEFNGNFVPADAIPNYLIWEFHGNDSFQSGRLSFLNDSGFDLELISLLGGMTSDSSVRISYIKVSYKPLDSNNLSPNNVFYWEFDGAYLPYSFTRGLIIPKDCTIFIRLENNVSFCRLVALPCLPVLAGTILSMG